MRSALLAIALTACGSESAVPAPIDAAGGHGGEGGANGGGDASDAGGAGGGQIGDACTSVEDCSKTPGSALCLTTVGIPPAAYTWPGGYCSSVCSLTDTDSCGTQAICVAYPGYPGLCMKTCSSSASCRRDDGYSCMMPPAIPAGVCATSASLP